jgi:hypothetical protein
MEVVIDLNFFTTIDWDVILRGSLLVLVSSFIQLKITAG